VTILPRSLFTTSLPGIGRPLSEAEGQLLGNYLNLLIKWQKSHRLLGSVEPAWIVENVFIDSFCFLEALPVGATAIADVGSGAGVPGIPVAIVRPDLRLSLIEVRQRRVSFLATVVRELGLAHVEVVAGRAERLGADYVGRFDAVVMRCAGRIDVVLGAAFRLVRAGGAVIVAASSSAPVAVGGEALTVQAPSGVVRPFHRYLKP
jgi:16S rRNA (guanine527-N7)-methyltransferase